MTRYLAGIVDLPYMSPDGRLVARPGYDPETRLLLYLPMDYQIDTPAQPTADDVRAALRVLAEPFSAYRFATANDAAGMVSGIFAAICRPVMDLCPAYLFDASQQGSGKTKAACALGAIIQGERVGVTPYSGSSTDDELRKRMVSGAVGGTRFHCLDNITGHFKSSVLAAVLTSGRLSDRILGQSRMVEAHVRSFVTLSGNNASIDADLSRRTVQIRIDAGVNPTHRAFAFDPVSVALTQRRRIAAAVCVVLAAYFADGAPDIVAGDAGGFASFNRLCRQPILWLTREGYADALPWPVLGDPSASMLSDPSTGDPELEASGDLLAALWALSEGHDFSSADALAWHVYGQNDSGSVEGALRSAVIECIGRGDVSVRTVGRVLMNRRDRVIGGLKLLARGAGRVRSWRVVLAE